MNLVNHPDIQHNLEKHKPANYSERTGSRPAKPVTVGILTTSVQKSGIVKSSKIQSELAYLSAVNNDPLIKIVVFSPWDIDWKQKTVRAYRVKRNTDGVIEWETYRAQLPGVVYDQIYKRNEELRYRKVREQLKEVTGGRFFNARFLNKWIVYGLLAKTQQVAEFLPETSLLRSSRDLQRMIGKHGIVYIKPVDGSLGRKIIRVGLAEDGRYYYQTRRGKTRYVRSLDEIMQKTRKMSGTRRFIVQQGLDLTDEEGRVMDIRVLLQKNHKGKWTVTKMYARLGPDNSITSNLAGGGTAYPLGEILESQYDPSMINDIRAEIREIAARVAAAIEKTSGELFAEFGIDIGLDRDGRLWLIEVNSKPRRRIEGKGSERLMELSFIKPIRYACYLARKERFSVDHEINK